MKKLLSRHMSLVSSFVYLREQMVRRIFCITSIKIRVISDPERR